MHDSHTSQPVRPIRPAGRQASRGLSWRCVVLGVAVILAAGFTAYAQEPTPAQSEDNAGFKVVIHDDNPTVEVEAVLIAKMFRKKVKRWDHGVTATPVDLESDSPIRNAFTTAVHRVKSVTAIQSYWQRMIFSGRDSPPEEKATEEEVLAFVSSHPGAIGYVSADKKLGDGVKELRVIP